MLAKTRSVERQRVKSLSHDSDGNDEWLASSWLFSRLPAAVQMASEDGAATIGLIARRRHHGVKGIECGPIGRGWMKFEPEFDIRSQG